MIIMSAATIIALAFGIGICTGISVTMFASALADALNEFRTQL